MKKLLLFAISLTLLFSCEKKNLTSECIETSASIQTKAGGQYADYRVNLTDVKRLLCTQKGEIDIICFPSEEDPTLFLVKTNPGFYIIAGDKRSDPIVAYSYDGDIDYPSEEALYALEEFSLPIIVLRKQPGLTPEMQENMDKWDHISRNHFAEGSRSRMTYYYLIQSNDVQFLSTNVGPLLNTDWGQRDRYTNDHYWNEYCPWVNASCTGAKSPVGCVAVSGGQFAYYMKDSNGVSVSVPVSASCTGYIGDGNYVQTFSSTQSTTMINEMPLNYLDTSTVRINNARIFLAYIGNQIGMSYGASGSSAFTSSLPYLFDTWGIDSEYMSFDNDIAIAQIKSSVPVVVRAHNSESGSGHSWVIDGYQRGTIIRQNYYYVSNVQLTEEQIAALTMDDWNGAYDEWPISYTRNYHMNWGWNGIYNGWFAIDNWSMVGYNYATGKAMIRIY